MKNQKSEIRNQINSALPTVVLFCALAFAGCGENALEDGGTFRFRLSADPPSLDPAHSTDAVSGAVVLELFDGLVALDPRTGRVVPAVADTFWASEDGLVWTFRLRRGVRFHNGRSVNADDVRYSFERVLNPATRAERPWVLTPIRGARAFLERSTSRVDGMHVLDDHTLQLELEARFSPFLTQLCMEVASIVPREEVQRWGDAFGEHPVGCGPFRFVEWTHDVNVTLEAFDGYYGGRPSLRRVEYLVLPDVSVALEKYKAGELDLLDDLPAGRVAHLQKRFPDQVKIWPTLSTFYLGMNLSREPFRSHPGIRRAVNCAIDKRTICERLLEGCAVPARGVLPPGLFAYDETLEGYPYDAHRARRLLAEEGFPNGEGLPEIVLWHQTSHGEGRIWQFVQSNLRDVGIRTRLRTLDWAAYLNAVRAGEAPLFRGSWIADYPDPHNFLFVLLHSSNFGDAGNYARYADPEFDRLVEEAGAEPSPERRRYLYRKAERLAIGAAPWAFLFHSSDRIMIRPEWKGLVLPAQGDWAIPLDRLFRLPAKRS